LSCKPVRELLGSELIGQALNLFLDCLHIRIVTLETVGTLVGIHCLDNARQVVLHIVVFDWIKGILPDETEEAPDDRSDLAGWRLTLDDMVEPFLLSLLDSFERWGALALADLFCINKIDVGFNGREVHGCIEVRQHEVGQQIFLSELMPHVTSVKETTVRRQLDEELR
jgi:hypothetical protein